MKTFRNIAYVFASFAFFLAIIDNFNIAGFELVNNKGNFFEIKVCRLPGILIV